LSSDLAHSFVAVVVPKLQMSNLQLLDFNSQEIRTVVDADRAVWFVAQDVCAVLDLSDVSQAVGRIADKQKRELNAEEVQSIARNQATTRLLAISEAGFYKLAFSSRKPEAEKFTDWLAEDVIPAIRKHGCYKTPKQLHLDEWQKVREESIGISVLFTKMCVKDNYRAGLVHDTITMRIVGKTAKELKADHDIIAGRIQIGLNHIADVEALKAINAVKKAFALAMVEDENYLDRLNRIFKRFGLTE
jgi:prophage antirepressor-like protein